MAVNPITNLPYVESFAAYASEWVRHFQAKRSPVRYYEILNEPWEYFGWEYVDFTKLKNYMQLFNSAAASMRRENSHLMISHDFIMRKPVLDYWLANGGADVDYLDFHKYGDWVVGRTTDEQMLMNAEKEYFGTWPLGYSIGEARAVWLQARGKLLPVINSEQNLNSAWESGTDPRIQQMLGAVWTALVVRMSILEDLTSCVYYGLSSSPSYGAATPTRGAGFGMINADSNQPWYPYYVHYMLGNNLDIGDQLVNITSSSVDIRTIAWTHKRVLNIFLICKVDQPRTVYLKGVIGEGKFSRIDNTISWRTPRIQSGVVNLAQPLVMNGYTVMLLNSTGVPSTIVTTTVTSMASSPRRALGEVAVNYFVANSMNYLVSGTGDRSELLIGYFTKYGDGGTDFLPIGHLYKSQVRELAKHLNISSTIVDKPASPELWNGQKATRHANARDDS
jgi:hypothetical protein